MNIVLHISVFKNEDKTIFIGGQGYSYENIISKNKYGYKGFINSDIGYIPTTHSVNYKFNIIEPISFIELYGNTTVDKVKDFMLKIKDRFKDSELTIVTDNSSLENILKEVDVNVIITESIIFNIGSDIAGKLAMLASNNLEDKFIVNEFKNSKYWSPNINKHPFINFKQIFTITKEHTPGKYTILKYDSENELGRKTVTAGYGVAILKEPIKELEELIKYYEGFYKDNHTLITVNTRSLYNNNIMFYYNKYKEKAIVKINTLYKHILTILNDTDNVIASNIHPIGLGYQAMDNTEILLNILNMYKTGKLSKHILQADITDLLYDKTDKGVLFKKELANGDSLKFKYDNGTIKHNIQLKLNVDLLERNIYKNIEKTNPSIYLMILNHNNIKLEYYSIIDCKLTGDLFIWCNYFTNVIFLKNKER